MTNGFTLLELILVMLVIGTVLATVAPSLRGFVASRRASDAAAQILALAKFARSQAAVEGRVYRLNLDTETGEFWLTALNGSEFEVLPGEFGQRFSLPDGVSARWQAPEQNQKPGSIAFYPDGRTFAADIRLEDTDGRMTRVVCAAPAEPFRIIASEEQ